MNKLYLSSAPGRGIAPAMISLADSPSENDLDAWQGKINKILDKIQGGDLKPEDLDRDLFDFTLNDIKRGFNSSFGISENINYDTPDFNFLSSIDKNLYRFAGAKSYQELSDFSRMLTGDDGKVVDFKTFRSSVEEYRSKALGIDEQYNKNWLYTEYTNSVNSGLAAKRWKEFEETADIFPNLEYRTAGDSLVRPEHQQLNGIIKRINDPFWDRYYPPNDWGCRCRARPIDQDPTSGKLPDVKIPELFDNNVGKTGEIYNSSHPYFNSNGISSSKTFATVRRFEGDDYYSSQLPKYNQMKSKYETVSAINEAGGSILQESGFIPEALNLKIARELSKLGDAIVLLRQDKTQATALVQGIKSSFGAAATASDISSAVAAGLPLSGIITIDLASSVKRPAIISSLSGYFKDPRFKSIIFLKSGKRCILTRKDLTLKNYEPLKTIGL